MEIIDYPNYLIYPDGKVWSNNSRFHKEKQRFMKPAFDGRYKFHTFCKEGKPKIILLHRLIAIHYISNPENKPCVDHINRIKTDNRIENLRWVSYKENSNNTSCHKTNISGHKNIAWDKSRNKWLVNVRGKKVKRFKNKIDAICYKFIRLLIEIN